MAWITVPGTPIDYPVALGEDNSYYLNHTVTGESNILGSIFATAGTDFKESHIILYGHNMASGKMFGSLKKYHDKDFRNTYPYVYVYTPETTYTCAIYSVYSTRYDSDVFTLGYKGDSEEWKLEYNARTSAERSNKREKLDFKLEDGRHRSTKMWYCRLYHILMLQHLDARDLPLEPTLKKVILQTA